MVSSTSSSESEDDDEKRKLVQALDPDFLKTPGTVHINGTGCSSSNDMRDKSLPVMSSVTEDQPVSKRSKLFHRSAEDSEFPKPYSLDVTPECQKFIAKQLAKSLEKKIKEVNRLSTDESPCQESADTGIKLFANSQTHLTENDLKRQAVPRRAPTLKKRKKKKKIKERGSSSSSSDSEDEKLKSVAVSADWVLNSV